MKKPLNLFFRFIIVFGLIFTLGNLFASFLFEDKQAAQDSIKQTYVVALFIVPIHHFMLRKKYANYVKSQLHPPKSNQKISPKKKKNKR